jgi:competence ComEA-like helix-hairpin-helix protein
MLKKLSVLIGLTEAEIKVLLFLTMTFLAGFSYKTFFIIDDAAAVRKFDYSYEDSLFFAIGEDLETEEDAIQDDKSVDYKQEVLDFNERSFSESNTKEAPAAKSINLNSAKIEELILLPGIGEKTAERILEFRTKRGKFNTLEELLEVKGIGDSKFQNVRKYLFIE